MASKDDSIVEEQVSTIADTPPPRETYGANKKFDTNRKFFSWFDSNDGPLERRLVLKLDVFILTFAFIGFWILYIDRGILANAYISGMKEDLNLFGNQLVQLNSIFSAGYCIAMIPATLLVTHYPSHIVIPTSMTLWGIFTLLCYRASSFSELAGYRFITGLLEGPYFCSIHYVLGSWYRSDELVRRAGIFYVSSGVGTMTTGLLAARIYQSLDGSLGHAGWRWMYIVASIMTFPVAAWGYISFPGTPKDGRRWYFTTDEFALAKERMELQGRLNPKGLDLSWKTIRRFFNRWHFWLMIPWNISWLLGYQSLNQGALTLWLKSNKQYATVQVNNFTAISPSLGIIFIMSFSWLVDKAGQRAIIPLVGAVTILFFISKLAFVLYDLSSFGYKWFAVAVSYIEVSLSPINYSIANLACAADAEERAFIISSMLAIGTAFNCWVPLLDFPTVQAPRYFKGYVVESVLQFVYFGLTCLVMWYVRRDDRKGKSNVDSIERRLNKVDTQVEP